MAKLKYEASDPVILSVPKVLLFAATVTVSVKLEVLPVLTLPKAKEVGERLIVGCTLAYAVVPS